MPALHETTANLNETKLAETPTTLTEPSSPSDSDTMGSIESSDHANHNTSPDHKNHHNFNIVAWLKNSWSILKAMFG